MLQSANATMQNQESSVGEILDYIHGMQYSYTCVFRPRKPLEFVYVVVCHHAWRFVNQYDSLFYVNLSRCWLRLLSIFRQYMCAVPKEISLSSAKLKFGLLHQSCQSTELSSPREQFQYLSRPRSVPVALARLISFNTSSTRTTVWANETGASSPLIGTL